MARTVLITGANGGVGRAVTARFLADGATVLAGHRDPAAAESLAATGARPVHLDVTAEPGLGALAERVDILVHAAGVSLGGPLEELPLDTLRRQLEVNVTGALRVTQYVVPGMRARGWGRVVTVSSVAGQLTMPGMGAYAMSKHALESMSEALRYELKPFGIGVSVVQPGGIDTPFADAERRHFRHGRPDGPYAEFTAEVVDRLGRNPVALHPDRVARIIQRAATARHPRPSYRVGGLAHVMLGLHDALPSRLWDRLVPAVTPTPAGRA
jgi:NAD(P)-dependent dehydrogenase (short-subunit alcohol dehydrogenase family)